MLGICTKIFFFQAEDGIRDYKVTGVQTCALPISSGWAQSCSRWSRCSTTSSARAGGKRAQALQGRQRSEEHTSELQSPCNLVCRLLLEKKNMDRVSPDSQEFHRHREVGDPSLGVA